MTVTTWDTFRHHTAVSPRWARARHHTRLAAARTLVAMAHGVRFARAWTVPLASYACFTVAAALLAPPLGWVVAGVCLLIAHQQAERA